MTRIKLVAIVGAGLVLHLSPLSAQRAHNMGGGVGGFSDRIAYSADYDSENGASPGSRLATVVLWRGQPGWASRGTLGKGTASQRAAQRAFEDQMAAAGKSGSTSSGGGVSGSLYYFADYNENKHVLHVLGNEYRVPAADSVIVVMVDRIDGIGGRPTVFGVAYLTEQVLPERMEARADSKALGDAHRRWFNHFKSALRSSPEVRLFLR